MVDAIDERTLLVECSHVLFRTSTVVDVASLVEKDRSVGALIAVDGYQAAGTQPVDVVALGVDIYLGGSVKYLSGGPGNGWMYAAPHVSELLEPVTAGWFGQLEPFAFDPENAYAPGIRRFAGGTLGVLAAYAAEPAYQALADIGLQRVRERSLSMTPSLLTQARPFTTGIGSALGRTALRSTTAVSRPERRGLCPSGRRGMRSRSPPGRFCRTVALVFGL